MNTILKVEEKFAQTSEVGKLVSKRHQRSSIGGSAPNAGTSEISKRYQPSLVLALDRDSDRATKASTSTRSN